MSGPAHPCRGFRRGDHVIRSVIVSGHRTTMAMEPPLWAAFDRVVSVRGGTAADLLSEIDRRRRPGGTLTSAVRVFLVMWLEARVVALEGRAA